MKTKPTRVVLNLLPIVIFMFFMAPSVGQNSDTLSFARESQHFNFYSDKDDIKVLDSLAKRLESNYSRITDHLGIQIDEKINVRVFPDLKSFHVAIGYPDSPDWVVGSWSGGDLMMVSPLNPGSMHTYESLMQVIVHEFVHLAVDEARGESDGTRIPRWLSEGYAQYEAGQVNDKVRKNVSLGLIQKTSPTWSQLDTLSMMEFGQMNGYGLSVTIVEFLITTYGNDKMKLLIIEPESIESIYGMSKDTLEEQWIQYMKTKFYR